MSVLSDIKASFEKINLAICNRKCELYCPSGSIDSQVEIPVVIDGTEILGTPIGSPSYVESKCVEISKSGQDLCTKLTELDDSQSALLLLRHCHVPRINHLARSVVPSYL